MQFICIFSKDFYLNFSFDKAIEINQNDDYYWNYKGIALNTLICIKLHTSSME